MKIERLSVTQFDDRGAIMDIVQDCPYEHLTIIRSRAGARRGDHFHKHTTQTVFLINGRMAVYAKLPDGPVEAQILEPGSTVTNVPFEIHAMVALEDSLFIVLTNGPRGGSNFEDDTFRVDPSVLGSA